jgi:hypothetical protein
MRRAAAGINGAAPNSTPDTERDREGLGFRLGVRYAERATEDRDHHRP